MCTPWRRTENNGIQEPKITHTNGVYNLKVRGKRNHKAEYRRLKNASCYRFGKKGHIIPMCL